MSFPTDHILALKLHRFLVKYGTDASSKTFIAKIFSENLPNLGKGDQLVDNFHTSIVNWANGGQLDISQWYIQLLGSQKGVKLFIDKFMKEFD